MNRYKNKYRVKSNRLQNWDYGWHAHYYVTICTKNRVKCFGDLVNENETVILSSIGKIACEWWKEIPKHFPLVKLRWTPTPSSGSRLAILTASLAAGILAIIVVLVNTPLVCACSTALFTLSDRPKSSAFIISLLSICGKFKRHSCFGQSDSVCEDAGDNKAGRKGQRAGYVQKHR